MRGHGKYYRTIALPDSFNHVVTFHDFFARFATPAVLPYTDFLMKWGHLLIGLSTGFRPARSGKRPFRHSAHDYLLLCPHGMAIYREPFQSFCRLPPGLRGRDRLPDGASCWSRLGLDGVTEQLPVVAHNRTPEIIVRCRYGITTEGCSVVACCLRIRVSLREEDWARRCETGAAVRDPTATLSSTGLSSCTKLVPSLFQSIGLTRYGAAYSAP